MRLPEARLQVLLNSSWRLECGFFCLPIAGGWEWFLIFPLPAKVRKMKNRWICVQVDASHPGGCAELFSFVDSWRI